MSRFCVVSDLRKRFTVCMTSSQVCWKVCCVTLCQASDFTASQDTVEHAIKCPSCKPATHFKLKSASWAFVGMHHGVLGGSQDAEVCQVGEDFKTCMVYRRALCEPGCPDKLLSDAGDCVL